MTRNSHIFLLLLLLFVSAMESLKFKPEGANTQVDGFPSQMNNNIELNEFLSTLNEVELDKYLSSLNNTELNGLIAQADLSLAKEVDSSAFAHVDLASENVGGSLLRPNVVGSEAEANNLALGRGDTCSRVGGTCRTGFWCRRGWRRVFVVYACRNRFLRICCRRR